MKGSYRPYAEFCKKLRTDNLLRQLPSPWISRYDFSTNDYLGLSQHPALVQAATAAALHFGVGSKASRLVSCDLSPLKDLESLIAQKKQTQAALVFNTGFQANLSVLGALLDPKVLHAKPLVFSDRLNHASMHVACQLSHVTQQRYRHADYDHLHYFLKRHKNSKHPKFILTESLFGMDGDKADLPSLIYLAKKFGAILYVDEAHATGIFGNQGYGLSSEFASDIDISMGTFSKALGGSGAYISCSKSLKRYLINRCQGFIYSTAPSPMQVAAMEMAWKLIPSLQEKAQQMLKTAQGLRKSLNDLGFNIGLSHSHIIPIILKDPAKTIAAQKLLAQEGIKVSAIRPPSVPPKQSRLRIALSIHHDQMAIESLLEALKKLNREVYTQK